MDYNSDNKSGSLRIFQETSPLGKSLLKRSETSFFESDFPIEICHCRADSVVFHELTDLRVTVDRLIYVPTLEAPPDRPYPFVYFITIDNQSSETITIRGRKWVITDQLGEKVVVEGDGVVGELPRLKPGERFSYNSYHVIGTDSVAEGSFLGITDGGEPFIVRIPRFEMQVPAAGDGE